MRLRILVIRNLFITFIVATTSLLKMLVPWSGRISNGNEFLLQQCLFQNCSMLYCYRKLFWTEMQQFVKVLLVKKKKKLNRRNICARNGVIEYESRNVSDLAISFLNKLLDQVKGRAVCLRSDNTNKERNFVICHCRRRMTLVTVSRFFSWVQWIYDSSVSQSLPLETMKFMAVWTICLRHKG